MIRIHKIIDSSYASGPGNRLLLVLQGCSIACKECLSPETHSSRKGQEMSVKNLLQHILSIEDIQGITITGGEPMEQAEALLELIQGIKKSSQLSIFLYTGFEINELKQKAIPVQLQLILAVDILCDGPYIANLATQETLWRGSSNQKIYAFSEKGRKEINEESNPLQTCIKVTSEEWQITGIPTKEMVFLLDKGLSQGKEF